MTMRVCPCCQSVRQERLHEQKFAAGALGTGYNVATCCDCGMGFADPVPSLETLSEYYRLSAKYAIAGSDEKYETTRFETTVDSLIGFVPLNARILDVGCGAGGLLGALKRRGFIDVQGIDPSPWNAKVAQEKHGVHVAVGSLCDMAREELQYDLITLVGVLEHLVDVRESLRTLAHGLTKEGVLYVAVPNANKFADCANAPFQQFSLEHVNFFTPSTLSACALAAGLHCAHAWDFVVEWRQRVTEPVAAQLFTIGQPGETRYSGETKVALSRYVEVSRNQDARAKEKLETLAAKGDPVMVWGVGALTRRLLAESALGRCNITRFIDQDPTLIGKSLAGRQIVSPYELARYREPILVCSVAFEAEIIARIRELGLFNHYTTLYTLSATLG